MSYWAATVVTSIIQRIPVIGETLYKYIVGGFSVTEATLVRAFSAHVCLAFVIVALIIIHVYYLHAGGSSNPLHVENSNSDSTSFHSSFSIKDLFVLIVVLTSFILCILFIPDFFMDSECFTEANPMVTPASIKPE